jgi:hypothetical protein
VATLSFGGAVIAAVGTLDTSTVEYAAADTAGKVPDQSQTLSALQADTFLAVAAGFATWGSRSASQSFGRVRYRGGWVGSRWQGGSSG